MNSYARHAGSLFAKVDVEPTSAKIHIDPLLETRGLREDTPLLVTIRVNPGYVPKRVSVRKQISSASSPPRSPLPRSPAWKKTRTSSQSPPASPFEGADQFLLSS